jgi:ABC-type bacteriocin/lantibiotic exporter with double-glycine peptidase domain
LVEAADREVPMQRIRREGSAVAALLAIAGCAGAAGSAEFDPGVLETQPGWIVVEDVPVTLQKESVDCGRASLAMVLAHWDVSLDAAELASPAPLLPGKGASATELRDFAKKKGLEAYLLHARIQDLRRELSDGHPVIVGLVKFAGSGVVTHYEVVVAFHPEQGIVVTHDPAGGWRQNTLDGFRKEWAAAGSLALVFVRPEPRLRVN